MIMTAKLLATTLAISVATSASAGIVTITGTRSNTTPPGAMGGRCAPALTINFAPGAFTASGTSNLGDFSYTASHCIAAPPPGNYFDGQFEWTFANGTLSGIHNGTLSLSGTPGQVNIAESLTFTGGTGRYAGATGSANFTGLLSFGMFGGAPGTASTGNFSGELSVPGIPEPASWAMLIAGFGLIGAAARRRQRAAHALA